MITHIARGQNLAVTRTPVGFKHIVTAQHEQPGIPTLGVEPNGALAWSGNGDRGYFERDSLAALATIYRPRGYAQRYGWAENLCVV